MQGLVSHQTPGNLVKLIEENIKQAEKQQTLRERALKVHDVLAQSKFGEAWTPYPFNSGYFMSFRVVSNQAELLRTRLLTERHIGTIAIQDSYLRVAYSGIDDIDIRPLYDEVYSMAASL